MRTTERAQDDGHQGEAGGRHPGTGLRAERLHHEEERCVSPRALAQGPVAGRSPRRGRSPAHTATRASCRTRCRGLTHTAAGIGYYCAVLRQPGVRAGGMQRGAAGCAARAAAEPERHRAATHVRHAQGAHCQAGLVVLRRGVWHLPRPAPALRGAVRRHPGTRLRHALRTHAPALPAREQFQPCEDAGDDVPVLAGGHVHHLQRGVTPPGAEDHTRVR